MMTVKGYLLIMRNLVAGTAGHIDHGKTSLIRALTGIETDRLAEEKRRGITIDLGFAHLQLTPELRVGFVDVPGHERFVKNMLAGVGGIDLVLFVVAADESVKPQTREHFEICRLLGIRHGIIVLTKADLVDTDILELVKLELEEFTAGSFLDGAPLIPVSSRSGEGVPQLKAAIAAMAGKIPLRSHGGAPRLPIDRAFSAKGFGTVVTGTLTEGCILPDVELQLYPANRTVRVRGLQVFGKPAGRAEAGQRTAVNLAAIEPVEIHRGMVLSEAGRFRPVTVIDCSLEMVQTAKPLKHRAPVHFHAGTAEIEAEVRFFNGQTAAQPGTRSWARIVLREPALLLPGDRFIIRMFSPVTTIGGGQVVEISNHKYKRSVDVSERLEVFADGTAAERVSLLVNESKAGHSVSWLASSLALSAEIVRGGAPGLQFLRHEDWMIGKTALAEYRAKLLVQVQKFHKDHPLLPGIPKASVTAPAELIQELLRSTVEILTENDIIRSRTHKLVLQEDETAARRTIEMAFESAGLTVPALAEVLSQSGIEDKRARSVLQLLIREGKLIKISNDLVFHQTALTNLRQLLSARRGTRISVGDFKDFTGISRKYAIPLLEYADREKWTRRQGDARVVS